MKKYYLFVLFSIPLTCFGQTAPNISKADREALELLFGSEKVKSLLIETKSESEDVIKGVEYFLSSQHSGNKYMGSSRVGNSTFFDFCTPFIGMVEDVVIKEQNLKGTFVSQTTDYKFVKALLHKFGEKLSLVEPCPEEEFTETKHLVEEEFSFNMDTVNKLGKSKVLAAVQNCRPYLTPYYPESIEKARQLRLNELENRLKIP